MAENKPDDFIELDVDSFDLDELLNYEPPPIQIRSITNHHWTNNNCNNQEEDMIRDAIDPMEDPFIQELFDEVTQISNKHGNVCQNESFSTSESVGELVFGSVPSAPISCNFCLVFREIVHTNGFCSTKLEIHGRVGMICHAVLVTQNFSGNRTHQMLNLSNKSIEYVKDILIQYCESRKQDGFVLLDDPMASFYEALCVGLDMGDSCCNSDDESDLPVSLIGSADNRNRLDIAVVNQDISSVQKTRYQKQREKAASLTVEEVASYFHLTLTRAAKELGLCATVVKRFCRRHGMPRWPYRKIKGYETKISEMKDTLHRTFDVNQKTRIEAEISWLQRKIDDIYVQFRTSSRFGV